MNAVINASPLIFLSKLDMLDCLKIYNKVYTTNLVIQEIELGLEKGYPEALLIKKLVEENFLIVKDKISKENEFGLHPGELSIIELAREMKIENIIVDDKTAINASKYFGLKVTSTPFLLLKNLKKGNIKLIDFRNAMDKLVMFGYFISPNLYMKILDKAETFE
jgi:predicted nucleic acid-binding protein